jgi:hypothetical protein
MLGSDWLVVVGWLRMWFIDFTSQILVEFVLKKKGQAAG